MGSGSDNPKKDGDDPNFITSPLSDDVKIESGQEGAVSENKVQSIVDGLTISVVLLGLSLGVLFSTGGMLIAIAALTTLLVTSVVFGVSSVDNKELPYEWQSCGERKRVVRKQIDLEEEERECMECGHDTGIGVERQAQDEFVVGGFTLRAEKHDKTYNCASCSTYINEEEQVTESISDTEQEKEDVDSVSEEDVVVEDETEETKTQEERRWKAKEKEQQSNKGTFELYTNPQERLNNSEEPLNSNEENNKTLWERLDDEIGDESSNSGQQAESGGESDKTSETSEENGERERELELA